ncbi:alpha/beta fold hydrolase [bacterium]|nr:alpha/beta fold hydrolase [bacterium]MBU3955685.1 alpha/beta fold hydrolase [bacterium]MBU4134250.1 alpha/beta fold hydrolase [bacterium]
MTLSKTVKFLKYIIGLFLVGYFAFMLMLALFQKKYIYYPVKEIITTPGLKGMEYEDVYFNSSDGVRLNGWFIPPQDINGETVLFCHGNADNISYFIEDVKMLADIGLGVFIFDYRGYGRSVGDQSETGTYFDAEAAWNYLTKEKKIPPRRIIILGRSLGGAIAAWLAKEHTPRALFLETAFTSIEDIASKTHPLIPVKSFLRYKYRTIDYLLQVKAPVLITHSKDDNVVPFIHGQKLFAAAGEPKKFIELSGSHRNCFVESGSVYPDGVKAFLEATR